MLILAVFCLLTISSAVLASNSNEGYYRYPAIYDNTVVFTSEGDLWKVSTDGGVATRLTTHSDSETDACISPDGKRVAFTGRYEGPLAVYIMPLGGGLPQRLTYTSHTNYVFGWKSNKEVMYVTREYSGPYRWYSVVHNIETHAEEILPLGQSRQGSFSKDGVFFFNRVQHQGSWAKRYKGGTAQDVWKWTGGKAEAVNLTSDYTGSDEQPVWFDGRVYFLSDRDGTMNVWSMAEDGSDKQQVTKHDGWDAQSLAISNGKIVYQLGADLYLYDISTKTDKKIKITLASDFDQKRQMWIDNPAQFMSTSALSSDGSKVAITARGQVFVAPAENGRFVRATRKDDVRYRQAVFMPDGKSVLALSDESGELEFWKIPANGVGEPEQLTDDGEVLRWSGVPSHDGKKIVYDDKDLKLWIYDTETKTQTLVGEAITYGYTNYSFSPDDKWLAFVTYAENFFEQIFVYNIANGTTHEITDDRFNSNSPVWSPDGEWLYFISDRNYETIYGNVWATRQQEAFLDKMDEIFMLPLKEVQRSPFLPEDEVSLAVEKKKDDKSDKKDDDGEEDKGVEVVINFDGMAQRLIRVPVPAGNYGSLTANDKQLIWTSRPDIGSPNLELQTVKLDDTDAKVTTLLDGLSSYMMSADGKKLLIRKRNDLYVVDAKTSKISDLNDSKVDLSNWKLVLDPVLQWRQMFNDAWRLHRDYFYDIGMHGLDWDAIKTKYAPLVERVSDRQELSNILGQMVSELETLHTSVRGGDSRDLDDDISVGALGARLKRMKGGEYLIERIYRNDPDYPDEQSPLGRPDLDLANGDIITAVNGVALANVESIGVTLRDQVGEEVLLSINDKSSGKARDVIVKPISATGQWNLMYNEWEYTRRLRVEEASDNTIGYFHLRNTSTGEYGRFARDFYPVYNRHGLIIDNRFNSGGQIDPWIISRLMRKSWAYWQPRRGLPESNQQYAFNGHIVVLINEHSASDGELITEGLRRMVGATVIGTRSWGGEVWLSSSNRLVDRGIATAAESGVYGATGEWLIEGHGVDPDIVVLNLPRETFDGKDAQLEAAIDFLKKKMAEEPIPEPKTPTYPAKAGKK